MNSQRQITQTGELLWSYLERADPSKIAVIHGTGRHTYRQLAESASAMAAALSGLGVRPGDVVSYQLPNWIETMILVAALMRLGAVANPIVPIYRGKEVRFITQEARTKVLFVPVGYKNFDYLKLAREAAAPCVETIVTCGGAAAGCEDFAGLLARYSGQASALWTGPSDAPAVLLYTSGTVANPKGVMHSQANLVFDATTAVPTSRLTPDEIIYMASPLTHVTGLLYGSFLPPVLGAALCLEDYRSAADAARLVERERCTWSVGSTPFLQGLLYDPAARKCDISSLRAFRCGGADVPPKLIRDAHAAGIQAFRSYGLSEHPTVTGAIDGDLERAATTDGQVHAHIDVRIVDIHDGSVLPPGSVGEIQTRGREVFLGYRDERLNADAFTADNWLRTGDMGSLDGDRYLTVVGRLKDIIIRKGENISAKEIEDVLAEHPAIDTIAVVALPDEVRGELVCAACTVKPGQRFDFSEMTSFLNASGLARQKFPERLEVLAALPMTASGKIRKSELRQTLLS